MESMFLKNGVSCILLLSVCAICCQSEEVSEFDLLGTDRVQNSIELIFFAPPRRNECFYQFIKEGSRMRFSYRVLTPATSMSYNGISTEIRTPAKNFLTTTHQDPKFESEFMHIYEEGVYEFCFINAVSRFNDLKTQMFIGIMNPRVEQVDRSDNATVALYEDCLEQVFKMLARFFHVGHRMHFAKTLAKIDFASLQYKMAFINNCSIAMVVIVCVVAYLQTYMLKRMFRVSTKTPSHKPRA